MTESQLNSSGSAYYICSVADLSFYKFICNEATDLTVKNHEKEGKNDKTVATERMNGKERKEFKTNGFKRKSRD